MTQSFLTRIVHNPNHLTPEQYGADEGYRLVYLGEQPEHVEARTPNGTHWFETRFDQVLKSSDGSSYRTKDPDPWLQPYMPAYFLDQLIMLKDDFRRILAAETDEEIREICENAICSIRRLMPSQPI